MLTLLLLGLVSVYGLVHLWLGYEMIKPPAQSAPDRSAYITVLVAARNEEANIRRCLEHLAAQHYPAERMQVLVGDDRSNDNTAREVQCFCQEHPNFQYHYIDRDLPGLKGKQNVLAQLAHHATGEFLLVTDADIETPPTWAETLVGGFRRSDDGMTSGPTLVDGPSLFAKMQAMDWLSGVSIIKALAQVGMPLTAVGNNMAIRRTTYDSIGGYENLPFSITEDYQLFAYTLAQGWRFRWLHSPEVLNRSQAIKTFGTFLNQRKRWYKGGVEGPWYGIVLVLMQVSINPLLILSLIFLAWPLALAAIGIRVGSDLFMTGAAAWRIRRMDLLRFFPLHIVYHLAIVFILQFYFLLPFKVDWKGRRY
jgi:cellulose synthase/poly-beta-1,6-N-acetylglucosamine synthase-like glycosyltransferase